jgi:predicted SAM-dependent methyltransferase
MQQQWTKWDTALWVQRFRYELAKRIAKRKRERRENVRRFVVEGGCVLWRLKQSVRTMQRRAEFSAALARATDVKLVVGANGTRFDGWISADSEKVLDLLDRPAWERAFANKRLKHVLAEHVFEHLTFSGALMGLRLIHEMLEPGGTLRFAVPDAYHPSSYYRYMVRPGGHEPAAKEHQYFWSIEDIPVVEQATGFRAEPLEYFDSEGSFHAVPFTDERGYIRRCSRHYVPNTSPYADWDNSRIAATVPERIRGAFEARGLTYTSLLVDFVKD